jgi:hypothetical protein
VREFGAAPPSSPSPSTYLLECAACLERADTGARQIWGMAGHSPSPHGIQLAPHRLGVRGERVGVRGSTAAALAVAPNLT